MSGIINSAGSRSGIIGETELDYEEGTWTPKIADTSDGDQMGYATQSASYRKIGKIVYICGKVVTNALNSCSGAIRLQGLPFSPSTAQPHCTGVISSGTAESHVLGGDYTIVGRVNQTDAIANLYKWSATGGTTPLTHSEWDASGEMEFGGSYITDI